jgi:hypothetical protein
MTDWTTRIDPDITRRYGVDEMDSAFFEPPDWPGKGPAAGLGIPECEFGFMVPPINEKPFALVNRPRRNLNVKYWTRFACEAAAETRAFLILNCDTAEQVAVGARRVAKLLPRYRRVAAERMYEPNTRVRENLS